MSDETGTANYGTSKPTKSVTGTDLTRQDLQTRLTESLEREAKLREQLNRSEANALELHRSGTIFHEQLDDIRKVLTQDKEFPKEWEYAAEILEILSRTEPTPCDCEALREALGNMLTAYEGEYTEETSEFHHSALDKARALLPSTTRQGES